MLPQIFFYVKVKNLMASMVNKSVVLISILLILYNFSAIIIPSEAQGTAVRISPSSISVNEGELFNVSVHIDDMPAPGMQGVQFKLVWNSSYVKGVSMTEVLFQSIAEPLNETSNIWNLTHVVADSYAEYAYTWQDMTRATELGYASISGSHVVAIITLNATATGTTTLHFTVIKVGGPSGSKLIFVSEPKYPYPGIGTLTFSLTEGLVMVGNVPPVIIILSPRNMTIYNTIPLNLTFTLSEDCDWIGYSLDGQANVTITGNTTLNPPNGAHNIIVYANDTTGLFGFSNMIYFTLDTIPPTASFTYSPSPPEAKIIFGTYKWDITFDASASADSETGIISYLWDFGDGYNGTGKTIQHIYRQPGTYTVTLTVKDGANHTDTSTAIITLAEPPAQFVIPWEMIMLIAIPIVWIAALAIYLKKLKKT
jgi:PKD repeat protein